MAEIVGLRFFSASTQGCGQLQATSPLAGPHHPVKHAGRGGLSIVDVGCDIHRGRLWCGCIVQVACCTSGNERGWSKG